MSYSEQTGYTPQTREQRIAALYRLAVQHGFTGNFTEFKGSNIHRIHSQTTLPALETMEDNVVEALNNLFAFMSETYQKIGSGSFGSSYEGWLNTFSPLCRGLNLIDSSVDSTLGVPGNVALYFDMLDTEERLAEVTAAFRKTIWPGMITPRGSEKITIDFSTAGGAREYRYYNLKEEDYTPLAVRVDVTYKARALQYERALIEQSVREQFEKFNRIGKNFYPRAYFDHNNLPNIASMTIYSSLMPTLNYSSAVRAAKFDQKFVLTGSFSVEVVG